MEVGYVARKESGRGAGELEALCEGQPRITISLSSVSEQGISGYLSNSHGVLQFWLWHGSTSRVALQESSDNAPCA